MDKKEILELFLKNGILLSPEEFEAIDEKNYMQMLRKGLGEKSGSETTVTIPRTGKMTCDQFIRMSNGRFESLREEILKKTEAVSINKGKKVFSEATIIGRVKEATPKGFILEDITGETEVVNENKDINVGDVLGMKGFFRENRFFPNQTVWPDIPLDNNPRLPGIRMSLTTKVKEYMSGIIICPDAGKADNVITGFGRLGTIKISKHDARITILAYSQADEMDEEAAVRMLKKRVVPDERVVENLIVEIPGILWIFNNKRNWIKNYRGVLIISSDGESFAEYDGCEVIFGKLGE
jgi:hypothetical protein